MTLTPPRSCAGPKAIETGRPKHATWVLRVADNTASLAKNVRGEQERCRERRWCKLHKDNLQLHCIRNDHLCRGPRGVYAGGNGSTTPGIIAGVVCADPPPLLEPVPSPLTLPIPLLLAASASADSTVGAFLSLSRSLSRANSRMAGLSSKLRITTGGLLAALEPVVDGSVYALLLLRIYTCFSLVRVMSGGLAGVEDGYGVVASLYGRSTVPENGRREEAAVSSCCNLLRRRRKKKTRMPRMSATMPAATPPPIAATGVPEEVEVDLAPPVSVDEDDAVLVVLHGVRCVSRAATTRRSSALTQSRVEPSRCPDV